ncbi:MAG: alpha/beta hydrolase [Chloroflexi bacterium]|nr:MAG: alpha/beta hydrolase [Chloroflexota bacterium]
MTAMKPTTLRVLTVLLFLAMSSGCAARPAQNASPTPSQTIVFEDCKLSSPGMRGTVKARCGNLAVYEDQEQKSERKIDLHIAVVPAVSRSPQPDALFLLAGGPGQAATEAFLPMYPVFDRLHQNRDIVLVDQRGTGQSNSLRCSAPDLSKGSDPNGDTQEPPKDFSTEIEKLKECQAQLKADTRLYTTAATVEDLEQVRTALGYERINLIGVSYGTRVAQAYQRRYPQHTRTATLDGVNPLDWELGPENPANAQRTLNLIFERCTADPACQAAFPDVRKEFSQLLEKLEKQPAQVTFPHPTTGEVTEMELTSDMLASTIQILSYTPETVAYIPLLIHETAERGDYSLLAAQYIIVMGELGRSISNGLYYSVVCAEDVAFYPAASVAPESASYLPDHTAEIKKYCAQWPHTLAPAEFKQPLKSDVPTLLLSGEADPITPPANAEKVVRNLGNALNLVVPGIGHNVIYRGCVPKIVTSFIEAGTTSGLDVECVQKIRPAPFMLNFAGSKP